MFDASKILELGKQSERNAPNTQPAFLIKKLLGFYFSGSMID